MIFATFLLTWKFKALMKLNHALVGLAQRRVPGQERWLASRRPKVEVDAYRQRIDLHLEVIR